MRHYLLLLIVPLTLLFASCEDSGTDEPALFLPDTGQDSLAVISTRPIAANTVRDGVVDSEAVFHYVGSQLVRTVVVRPLSADSDSIVTTYEYQGSEIITTRMTYSGGAQTGNMTREIKTIIDGQLLTSSFEANYTGDWEPPQMRTFTYDAEGRLEVSRLDFAVNSPTAGDANVETFVYDSEGLTNAIYDYHFEDGTVQSLYIRDFTLEAGQVISQTETAMIDPANPYVSEQIDYTRSQGRMDTAARYRYDSTTSQLVLSTEDVVTYTTTGQVETFTGELFEAGPATGVYVNTFIYEEGESNWHDVHLDPLRDVVGVPKGSF